MIKVSRFLNAFLVILQVLIGVPLLHSNTVKESRNSNPVRHSTVKYVRLQKDISDLQKKFDSLEKNLSQNSLTTEPNSNFSAKNEPDFDYAVEARSRSFPSAHETVLSRNYSGIGNQTYTETQMQYTNSHLGDLHFYIGFSIPKQNEYRGYEVDFTNGYKFDFEYLKDFGAFSLGPSINAKFYKNKRILAPHRGWMRLDGQNSTYSISLSSNLQKNLWGKTFIRLGAKAGMIFLNHEMGSEYSSFSFSDTSFYYSFLLGIGYKWKNIEPILYYEFDGFGRTEHFDSQTFHQIGLGIGIGF